jgi:hypothetical protein
LTVTAAAAEESVNVAATAPDKFIVVAEFNAEFPIVNKLAEVVFDPPLEFEMVTAVAASVAMTVEKPAACVPE